METPLQPGRFHLYFSEKRNQDKGKIGKVSLIIFQLSRLTGKNGVRINGVSDNSR